MRLDQRKHDRPETRLSAREIELIHALLAGATTYRKLAATMAISERTVADHLRSIYRITKAHNLADLIFWSLKNLDGEALTISNRVFSIDLGRCATLRGDHEV